MSEQDVASGTKAVGRSMTSGKVASLNRTRSTVRLGWLVPTLYILFLMLPLYWLINMSFKTNQEITGAFRCGPGISPGGTTQSFSATQAGIPAT